MAKRKKTAEPELPKTSPAAMAAKPTEKTEEDLDRDGDFDLEDLLRAERIKNDPKRMERVFKAHEKKHTQLRSIEDLKTAYRAKFEGKK